MAAALAANFALLVGTQSLHPLTPARPASSALGSLAGVGALTPPPGAMTSGGGTAVVWGAVLRAVEWEREAERIGLPREEATVVVSGAAAAAYPVVGSCVLLGLFFFFSRLASVVAALMLMSSAVAFCVAFGPGVGALAQHLLGRRRARATVGVFLGEERSLADNLTLAAALCVAGGWLLTGSWILGDLLGAAVVVSFVSFVHLPNLRVAAALCLFLFAYDFFWVFLSERYFGQNVMVQVATQRPGNPVTQAAEALNIAVPASVPRELELPVKLVFPRDVFADPWGRTGDFTFLGLGDMALPGLLVALGRFEDLRRQGPRPVARAGARRAGPLGRGRAVLPSTYAGSALAGYSTGLALALAASLLSASAQPALIYIAPLTLGGLAARARSRGELAALWARAPPAPAPAAPDAPAPPA